ncbi:autotransporter domain-containing protein [Bradyrhizobium manausense]|uniref:autotransporter outer membrane beta-barrel domain-containing protein n=1 Tax=Bradyrhizobium TaxID=374 RepID=UPI001BA5C9DC|nr:MULTISPECIES: autotransporter domain-containing protein [Bradyrhizobium]MBR0829683.1 autotransporter domain-containing protein [Bradyrhizobium manausense]UVO25303.1 autotransporter domain-containing protein [Bradyrhizobium arachidis]
MAGAGGSRPARRALSITTLLAVTALLTGAVQAQDATWQTNPGSGNYNASANWSPATVPTGTAFFGTSNTTALSISSPSTVGGWTFNAGASNYTFTISNAVDFAFTGAGIVVNGGSVSITSGGLAFHNSSTAGSASITNNFVLQFLDSSTAGTSAITNNGIATFDNTSSAGSATVTTNAGGGTFIRSSANGGTARFILNGTGYLDISQITTGSTTVGSIEGDGAVRLGSKNLTVGGNNLSTTFSGVIQDGGTGGGTGASLTKTGTGTLTLSSANSYTGGTTVTGGLINFNAASNFGSGLITLNGGGLQWAAGTTTDISSKLAAIGAGGATFDTNANVINFATALSGTGGLTVTGAGTLTLSGVNTYAGATTVNHGVLGVNGTLASPTINIANNTSGMIYLNASTAGSASITNDGNLVFANTSTAGTATITNNYNLQFGDFATAGSAVITNNGVLMEFVDHSTAGSATITNNTFLNFFSNATAGNAAITNGAAAGTDFSTTSGLNNDNKISAGSIAGGGTFALGQNELTVGSNNLSTTVTGSIIDGGLGGGTGASLIKVGTGKLTLEGNNTYTGATTVDGGILAVNGSIASSVLTTVNAGGTLGGNGFVGNTLINGGALAPGNSIGLLTVQGSLTFTAASSYMVEVSPATADRTNVTGTATLGNATVNATFAPGTYVAKQYTIVHANSINGSFSSLVNTNLPSGFAPSLSYDTQNAYLNLVLSFTPPSGNLNINQQNVANALINFFNSNGTIPIVFGSLTPAGLTQISGEVGSAPQQATFNAMNQFMGLMTDPFISGRGDPVSAGGSPNAYTDESMAYAATGRGRGKSERDAYAAVYTKAPVAPSFEQRWSIWAAGFGGSQNTDGNAIVGSNNTTSSLYATAVGADYRVSRDTLVGFALAGGGTNFTVANALGGGRSDLFQAGAFFRHIVGPAYVTGALAYGWQDVVTDRTVTVAAIDRLRAEFNANAWSGRLEGGYRFVAQGIGLTPYAAAQVAAFDLPAYAEQAIVGSNQFALAYNARSVTDTRTELGLRTDKSFAQADGIVTLRGRMAWAHDFNPDRAIGATFQTLPGASFVVNGAAMAADSALVTGAVEKKWLSGWSAAGTFEGEFSSVTRSYAGKGVVRYAW